MKRLKSGPPLGTPRTHGLTTRGKRPATYGVWAGMRGRCANPNDTSYPNYGGRGITICAEWDDFAVFHAWAMTSGYRKGLTLDRIDNDGPYAPDNCRWANRKTQSRNRRGRRYLTLNGRTRMVAEWAEEIGLSTNALLMRLRIGWSVEKALTTPKRATPATQPVLLEPPRRADRWRP